MEVKLYAMAISHPSQAARKMLEIKGVDYELVFPSYPGPLPPFLPSDWLRP